MPCASPPLLPITTAHFGFCTPAELPHSPSLPVPPVQGCTRPVLKCCLFRRWQTPSASLFDWPRSFIRAKTTHASCQASKIPTLFTWWASQNWSSAKVKCIKNLEGFGLTWHTTGHRGSLWQNKYGHVDIQSVGRPNYWGILLPTGDSKFILPKSLMAFCTEERGLSAVVPHYSLSFLHSLSQQIPLCLWVVFTTCVQETMSLGSPTLGESPQAQGIPWGILWLVYGHLPGLCIALCSRRKASQTRETCSLVLFLVQQCACKKKILPRRRQHWESNQRSGCAVPGTCCWQCQHSLVDNTSLHRYLLFHLTDNYNDFFR